MGDAAPILDVGEIPTEGRWLVRTASGAAYVLDLENMQMSRKPGEESNHLRRDNEIVPLLNIITLQQDVHMEVVIVVRETDDLPTYRRTTAVTSIEYLGKQGKD